MFIDIDSIKIYDKNGNNALNLKNYLVEAKYGFNKLWASDSGRNLKGKQTGTLLGIFPKITLSFKKLSKTELEAITPYLDSAYQYIRYYDPTKKAYKKIKTYTGDYEITNKRIVDSNKKNETFSISFIAVSKRS